MTEKLIFVIAHQYLILGPVLSILSTSIAVQAIAIRFPFPTIHLASE